MRMRILPALALAIIAAAVLAACGGSDDDDAPTRRPRDAAEATSTPFLDRQATNTQAPVTTRPATALPGSPLTSPTVTPSVAPVVAFPARRADGAIQRDPCGKYTIVREAVTVPGQKFPSADKITVLTADGNLVVELKNDEPFTNVGVDWCYDVNADGNPELSVYTFSGGAHCCITQAIYSFAAAKSSLFLLYQAGNAGSLTPKELDGKPPIELTGFDDRLAYFGGISYAASPTLVTVYAGRDGKYVEATKDFKPVIEQYRSQLVSQFRTCESQPADQRFQCQQGLGLGIMAESLVIGDWDTFVGTLNPPANVRDWLASHRAELVAELAKPKPQ
jgi:hypothetical protein